MHIYEERRHRWYFDHDKWICSRKGHEGCVRTQCQKIARDTKERCTRGATDGHFCRSHAKNAEPGPELVPCRLCRIPLLPRQVADHRCPRTSIAASVGSPETR